MYGPMLPCAACACTHSSRHPHSWHCSIDGKCGMLHVLLCVHVLLPTGHACTVLAASSSLARGQMPFSVSAGRVHEHGGMEGGRLPYFKSKN